MKAHAEKTPENKSQVVADSLPKPGSKTESTIQLVDNRPEAIAQRKLQEKLHNGRQAQKKNHATTSQHVIQRVKINLKTVSPAVLAAFHKANNMIQHMFLTAEELPGFFQMSEEQQIQYFHVLDRAMPMLEQMIQVQGGQRMIGHEADQAQMMTRPHMSNLLAFLQLNPNFIQESLSLFHGGGGTFHFFSPGGPVTLHLDSLRALMPPAPQSIQSRPDNRLVVSHTRVAVPAPARRPETAAERIVRKKRQYTHPGRQDRQRNRELDRQEERSVRALLIKSFPADIPRQTLEGMDFRQLELEHAKLTYAKGSLAGLKSMKRITKPRFGKLPTHIDKMRKSLVADPDVEHTDYTDKLNADREKALLEEIMPRLVELSYKIRLTHYYDSASEESILDSGRLQSKERRIRKAGGKDVPNKSGKLDDKLGNTDHVFFFGEYEEDEAHRSPFRNTRFGGDAETGDAVLHQKQGLDGTERRVSFPLNSVPAAGIHGYLDDLNSKPSLDAVHHVFSGMAMHKAQKKRVRELQGKGQQSSSSAAAAATTPKHDDRGPAEGAHLLMDLLRQRFTQSNFPGNKNLKQMIADLKKMTLPELYRFLFRKHPRKEKGDDINPQILVPGSVPFQTPGVRFDSPPQQQEFLEDKDND